MKTNPLPLLYTFRRCPYAMRARMAIFIAKIRVEYVEVSLKKKPESLLEYSPKGTVPVIVTTTGEVIDQSRDIMLWALRQNDPDDWLLQHNVAAQKHMEQLIDQCDNEFKPLLDRYKYFDRYPENSQQHYRQQAEFFLQILETHLIQHDFLMDEKICFVDAAIFPFIRQFANTDSDWFSSCPYKNLQHWLNLCVTTAMFGEIMRNT